MKELRRPVNAAIFAGVVVFTYVWGLTAWSENEVWSLGWWFDELGHFIAGVGIFFAYLHLWSKYSPGSYEGTNKVLIAFFGIAIVIFLEALLWECLVEGLWDALLQPHFPWLAKAQKNAADTNIDIIGTAFGALIGADIWWIWNIIYNKLNPDEAERIRIKLFRERAKAFGQEIRAERRANRKQIWREFKTSMRKKMEKKINP